MASKDLIGREPIVKLTLKQDFCSRSWGDGTCKAGLINMVSYSTSISTSNWAVSYFETGVSEMGTIPAAPFPFSTYEYFRTYTSSHPSGVGDVDYEVSTRSLISITNPLNSEYLWFSGIFQLDPTRSNLVGIGVHNATGTHKIYFNQDDASFDSVSGFTEYEITNVYSNFYKISAKALTANVVGGKFQFISKRFAGGDFIDYKIGYPVAAITKDQKFAETFADPVINQNSQPCFNTRATCQDSPNYDVGVLPLKFVKSRSPIPNDDYYLPCLESVSVTPAKLNPAGANKSSSALGERATFTATFKDFPHNDKMVDPYRLQRDYNPLDRGTFWTKWATRNPYYMHRIIEIESGYLSDGQIIDSITRTFVITSFDGVDSAGAVKISGRDILTLFENTKAQAPRASSGKLSANIGAGAGAGNNFTLTPSGVGDLEYPASGYVRIEKEVIQFTRTGDTVTPVTRGTWGTTAETHDEGATVQLCLHYNAQKAVDIFYDLALNYANVPIGYLDKANWDIEGSAYLPALYTALISEPTGVSKLTGEMCEQMFFSPWWDERANLVKLRAVRSPQDDPIYYLDDSANFIKDSVSWRDLPDQLITQVDVYYGMINVTLKLDDPSNYSVIETQLNLSASNAQKHGINRIKSIFSRWIPSTSSAVAVDLAENYINRFSEIPKQLNFRVDAKDSFLWLGDFVYVQNRLLVDFYGQKRIANLQIVSANEVEAGSKYAYQANEYFISTPDDPNLFTVPIATNTLNVNLRDYFDNVWGVTLTGTETINFIVRSGVVIGGDTAGGGTNVDANARNTSNDFYDAGNWQVNASSASSTSIGLVPILQKNDVAVVTTTNALDEYRIYSGTGGDGPKARWTIKEYPISTALVTGNFPTGTTVNLIIESGAYIVGEGGNGLCHANINDFTYPIPAGDGGDAMEITYPINIYNNGIIAAGGGGGASCIASIFTTKIFVVTGGGGAGTISNVRGICQVGGTWPVVSSASSGSASLGGSGGKGEVGTTSINFTLLNGQDSSGGNLDSPGKKYTWKSTAETANFGLGGDEGKAVSAGADLINWIIKGDVRGVESV